MGYLVISGLKIDTVSIALIESMKASSNFSLGGMFFVGFYLSLLFQLQIQYMESELSSESSMAMDIACGSKENRAEFPKKTSIRYYFFLLFLEEGSIPTFFFEVHK